MEKKKKKKNQKQKDISKKGIKHSKKIKGNMGQLKYSKEHTMTKPHDDTVMYI